MSEGLSVEAGERLWISVIRPVLEYGMEVVGGVWLEAELIQNEVGRRLLGANLKTATDVIRGELGWWSMKSRRDLIKLRFWGRICRLREDMMVKKIYRLLKKRNEYIKSSWFYQIKTILINLNLAQVWDSEEVGTKSNWKTIIGRSLKSRELREWKARMANKPKLRLYRVLKLDLIREDYLDMDITFAQRKALTSMRSGTHVLRIESGRWEKEEYNERLCKLCNNSVENEQHFFLSCYVLDRIRDSLVSKIKSDCGVDINIMDKDAALIFLLGNSCRTRDIRCQISRLHPQG